MREQPRGGDGAEHEDRRGSPEADDVDQAGLVLHLQLRAHGCVLAAGCHCGRPPALTFGLLRSAATRAADRVISLAGRLLRIGHRPSQAAASISLKPSLTSECPPKRNGILAPRASSTISRSQGVRIGAGSEKSDSKRSTAGGQASLSAEPPSAAMSTSVSATTASPSAASSATSDTAPRSSTQRASREWGGPAPRADRIPRSST